MINFVDDDNKKSSLTQISLIGKSALKTMGHTLCVCNNDKLYICISCGIVYN